MTIISLRMNRSQTAYKDSSLSKADDNGDVHGELQIAIENSSKFSIIGYRSFIIRKFQLVSSSIGPLLLAATAEQ